ncbi:CoA transferase [Paraburkholderia piptadeniae]|uniref:CoA transferase n=2 Tax=Paraburkholderia piptadeniae TaxID=1701573 RepID=A0A1N7SE59_9BURK|nr:CoA transferase [Paraburkholderia piptadeniae]
MRNEKTKSRAALGSLRVVDLTRVLAGPWAMQIFGDLGAEIIKIERPGEGDECRHWGPPWIKESDGSASDEAAYFLASNRNKKSVAVDISKAEGQRVILDLVANSDIFIENFKVGVLKKYGLDYESIRKVRPDIIYLSLTGFGQDGPYSDRPGYDYLFQGLGGLMSVTGEPDGQPGGGPQRIGIPLVDMFSGMYASVALLAALYHRKETGQGQYIDISLFDTVLAIGSNPLMYSLVGGKVQQRSGRASPSISPYGVYPARDGLFIVASANQSQWQSMCRAVGRPELAVDPRFATNGDRIANQAVLNEVLAEIFTAHDRGHWEEVLNAAGVPVGPINDYFQAIEHPQAKFRQSILSLPHGLGVNVPGVASPLRMSETPVSYRSGPPLLGQHTREVLSRLPGMSPETLSQLEAAGVIQQSPPR